MTGLAPVSQTKLRSVRARLVGCVAYRNLLRAEPWWITAVFRRSFYCAASSGAHLCVGSASLSPGPLNVSCDLGGTDWRLPMSAVGRPVRWAGQRLWVADRLVVDLSPAVLWQPERAPSLSPTHLTSPRFAALLAAILAQAPAEGLGRLAFCAPRVSWIPLAPPPEVSPLLRMARRAARPLWEWLRRALAPTARTIASPPPEALTLLGLGPGLTPSGDDFLAGVCIALHALRRPDIARALSVSMLTAARDRTHAISLAHLRCAAEGLGVAALHDCLAALASPQSEPSAIPLVALGSVGHTSGWDALAGALSVLACATDVAADAVSIRATMETAHGV